jgi:hypothetical protein
MIVSPNFVLIAFWHGAIIAPPHFAMCTFPMYVKHPVKVKFVRNLANEKFGTENFEPYKRLTIFKVF